MVKKSSKKPSDVKTSKRSKATPVQIESMTVGQINDWKKAGRAYTRLQSEIYASLSSQRAQVQDKILESLASNASKDLKFEKWTRILPYEFADRPLDIKGSLLADPGGRFNFGEIDELLFPRFGALYIAKDRGTAIAEYFGQKSLEHGLEPNEYSLRDSQSIAFVSVNGEIESYIDLSSTGSLEDFVAITKRVKIPKHLRDLARKQGIDSTKVIQNSSELLLSLLDPDWRAMPAMASIPANCQVFGQLVLAAGIEGIVYPSVRGESQCIAIFPQNFRGTGSYVEIVPPYPPFVSTTRIESSTRPKK